MEAKNTLLNNQEIIEEIKEEINTYLETNDNENTMTQYLRVVAKQFYREVYSNKISAQETRKISNSLTLHLKQLEKEEQK